MLFPSSSDISDPRALSSSSEFSRLGTMTRPSNSESSRSKFKVFDFDGDDDRSENMHKRFSADLLNRNNNKNRRRDSPVNKYNFLQTCKSFLSLSLSRFFFFFFWVFGVVLFVLEKMREIEKRYFSFFREISVV